MPNTYTLHKDLVDQNEIHIPKYHADTHYAGGSDAIDWEQIADLKTYIDSQISGENHWDMGSGNTEIYHNFILLIYYATFQRYIYDIHFH